MPNIIVGDGSTLEEGCILEHVTIRHYPKQTTPAQSAGGIFRRYVSMIGSDGARPGSSAWPGQVFAIKHLPSQAHHPPPLGRHDVVERRRSLFPGLLDSCPRLSTISERKPDERTHNSVTEAKTSRHALPVSWNSCPRSTASGRELPAMLHRRLIPRLLLG